MPKRQGQHVHPSLSDERERRLLLRGLLAQLAPYERFEFADARLDEIQAADVNSGLERGTRGVQDKMCALSSDDTFHLHVELSRNAAGQTATGDAKLEVQSLDSL